LACGFLAAVDGDRRVAQPDFERAYHIEAVLEAARQAIAGRLWVALAELPG